MNVEHVDENASEQLKEEIAQSENELRIPSHSRTTEEWGGLIDKFITDFWADTPAEEQSNIVEAIRSKNILSDVEHCGQVGKVGDDDCSSPSH